MAPPGARIGTVLVRTLGEEDREWKQAALVGAWGSTAVARKGVLIDAGPLPGFVAVAGGVRVGLLLYSYPAGGDGVEVVSVQAEPQGAGVGRALMDAVLDHARQIGAGRIWLVTTNDNTRAIRFYQQWGMDLTALVPDGAAASRRVKPSIPVVGHDGIPLRHELEFTLTLDEAAFDGGPGTGDTLPR
jgi:ribosomal protein S18 acetylase RimI-like enzyme